MRASVALIFMVFQISSYYSTQAGFLINGDFESGNTGFESDYTFNPSASLSNSLDGLQYKIVTNPSSSHFAASSYTDHTTGAGLMLMVNGVGNSSVAAWRESVAVNPFTEYRFSLFVSSWTGPPDQTDLLLSTLKFTINDQTVGSVTAPKAVWTPFSVVWNSGSSKIAKLQVFDGGSSRLGGNDFALDDIAFSEVQTVPEPSSILVFALGGFGTLLRGRLRRTSQSRNSGEK